MSSRHHESRDHATPGPGMYQAEAYNSISRPRSLSTTLKSRRGSNYDIRDTPAPDAYAEDVDLDSRQRRGSLYSLRGRSRDGRIGDSPGPGQYESGNRPGTPSYSLSGRPRRSRQVIEHMARSEI